MKIVLRLPPKALWPNARVHWREKATATKEYRALAWAAAAIKGRDTGVGRPMWERAETQAVFYFATNRRRDQDSCASSLKSAWDGIADAGIVANDAGLTHAPPEMRLDKLNPRVEITIRELPEPEGALSLKGG